MNTILYVMLGIIAAIYFGFLTPAIPVLLLSGRVVSRRAAVEIARTGKWVVTYNTEMGFLHRVWLNESRPITRHLMALRTGSLVWMPFATQERVRALFGKNCVVVRAGDRLDYELSDGRTLFDHTKEAEDGTNEVS